MKTVSLSGSLRENVGKKDAKKHRREGFVPCVMYGGKEQFHFVVSDKSFPETTLTRKCLFSTLRSAENLPMPVIQEVQYHPVTDNILHIDFLEVIPEKPVVISVPVKLEGTAPAC